MFQNQFHQVIFIWYRFIKFIFWAAKSVKLLVNMLLASHEIGGYDIFVSVTYGMWLLLDQNEYIRFKFDLIEGLIPEEQSNTAVYRTLRK